MGPKDQTRGRRACRKHEPEWFSFFTVAFYSGLRQGELFGLPWEAVDFVHDRIHVFYAVNRQKLDTPKSGKTRSVKLHPVAKQVLLDYREARHLKGGLIWPGRNDNTYLEQYDIKPVMNRIIFRAGLPKIRFHDTRHSFASMLLNRGADLVQIRDLLGHSSVAVTEKHYAEQEQERYDSAVGLLFSDKDFFGELDNAMRGNADDNSHDNSHEDRHKDRHKNRHNGHEEGILRAVR